MSQEKTESAKDKIERVIENFKAFLLAKNTRYGGTGITPLGIFCPAEIHTGIESRIDDKLARIKVTTATGQPTRKNDVADLIGYLFLLCIRHGWLDFTELID